jgi:hypothetical protein
MNLRNEAPGRPLLLLGLTAAFIAGLLLLSGGGGPDPAKPRAPSRLPGAMPLVPGAPLDGFVASPVPSAPPTTIVDDVRQTLKRLPLDRNNPPGSRPAPLRPG